MKTIHKDRILISRQDFENGLSRFGLKIDFEMICKYQDTHSQNQEFYSTKNPFVFTIDFKDETGQSWANIYSRFYDEHTKPKTDLFKEFKEFIDTHSFKVGKYELT